MCGDQCTKMGQSVKKNAEKTIKHLTNMAARSDPQDREQTEESPGNGRTGKTGNIPLSNPRDMNLDSSSENMDGDSGGMGQGPGNMFPDNEDSDNQSRDKKKKAPKISSAILEQIKNIQKSTDQHKLSKSGGAANLRYGNLFYTLHNSSFVHGSAQD
jgi:hypothetical protein